MKNYLKPIVRNALKNKGVTFLNIFGLTVALVCSIFLISWVIHETSYDWFVKNKDKIYRVVLEGEINGELSSSTACVAGIGPEATKLFPEIESYTRLNQRYANSLLKSIDNKAFRAKGYVADSTFFDFFPFRIVAGDLSGALGRKNNIVIENQLANKFFGNDNAIGKQLFIDGQAFTVSAVIEDIPSNSHLQFQFLVPTLNMPQWWVTSQWEGDNAITYLKLNSGTDISSVADKITNLVYNNEPFWKDFKVRFFLQNIQDIPFSGQFKSDYAKKTNKRNIYALSGIAFLILLIACINFTNLFISSALKRKKATGIKITTGASKFAIIKEYLAEVFAQVFVSFTIALLLLKILQPYFNHLSGSMINIDFFSPQFILVSLPVLIITTFLAGFFPGIYLSKFKPAEILKNKQSSASGKTDIRKILVVTQFSVAIVLVFAVTVIYKQVDFLQSKDLGFNKENVIYVYTTGKLKEDISQARLKSELLKNPNITGIAYRSSLPTVWSSGLPVLPDPAKDNYIGTEEIRVDKDYFDLMKISFIEGGSEFSEGQDSLKYCIINKQLADASNIEPPYLNKLLFTSTSNYNNYYIIKGVVKNANTKALYQKVDPCIYLEGNKQSETGIMLFKLTNNYEAGINALEVYWQKEFPDQLFEYWFLDQTYDQLYNSEMKARAVLSWFATLALILTSLGLLSMTYFIAEHRTKEIGIRKVNGAKVSEILAMLNKDFVKWVVIAFIVATPIAYYAMNKWLENFAYKTTLSWWIFALAGLLALGIALLTVSFQSWKAATKNPVESLRYE